MKTETKSKECYHCGDTCRAGSLQHYNKNFCCRGCKTVYEILSQNELSDYYNIEKFPGRRNEEISFYDFSYLDIPEIKDQILTFSSGGIDKLTFSIPGIHCSSCIWLLENLHKINSGIVRSEVNFLKKEVSIQYKSAEISLRKLAEILDSIGYKPLIDLKEKERKRANKRKDLSYVYKLGISGFAFGNIMLLSFPEYFSGGMYDDANFGTFFGYINLILALPVFFYSSSSYFVSAWKGIKNKFLNIDVPISLGIITLFIRSTYEVLSLTGAGYFDSMTGLVFFLLVGRWFQNRTYQALSFEHDYRSYFPMGVIRIIDNEEEVVLVKDLKVGDHIVIHHGEIIPADSILIEGIARIDYSFVTGESDLSDMKTGDKLYAGGKQDGAQIRVEVERDFSQSYLMQLWKQEEKEDAENKNLSRSIDRVSQYFTAVILIVAFISGAYWYFIDVEMAFHAFSSVLIIACPCALALTIPFTYGNGMKLLEKAGMYLRDARFIEVFASADTIVFDKTGTITSQKNRVVEYFGDRLNLEESVIVKSLTRNSTHPLSRVIHNKYAGYDDTEVTNFSEEEGRGIQGLILEKEVLMGSSEFTSMKNVTQGTAVYLSIGGEEKGVYSIKNEYRQGLTDLVKKLNKNYQLEVITGDGEGEKETLLKIFGKKAILKFRMNPFEKRDHINDLKKKGRKVIMIGDGLNDAGAIKTSDVGISVSDDIFGFLPSCDAIMESNIFRNLSDILIFSKQLKRLVITGFIISFLYNIVGLTFAVQGILSPISAAILMPISSITVVSFAIFSTNLVAKKNNII